MTHTLPVKEHLHNGELYQPPVPPSLGEEWKRRLFFQRSLHKQLEAVLRERKSTFKRFVVIGVPIASIGIVFAAYFGFMHPEQWFDKLLLSFNFDIPPIGLKEVLFLALIVNGLTFSVRKRFFAL